MGNKRQAILILGMHRSGTSMIASVVHMLGQSFAQAAELRYSEIINSRTWRWTAAIRKWVK